MVSLHGRATVTRHLVRKSRTSGLHEVAERPPDPHTLLNPQQLQDKVEMLLDWFQGKSNVLALTGAGVSTESGIPDYRGNAGSYHEGHKPMIHDQFISSESHRRRYWGRSLVGWKEFDEMQPNAGHLALADLERLSKIGVSYPDELGYYAPHQEDDFMTSTGEQKISIITQNVDRLHSRAGARNVVELHGRTDRLQCQSCGNHVDRRHFHDDLQDLNQDWLSRALQQRQEENSSVRRPDGDALVQNVSYDDIAIPPCPHCHDGFLKPTVVFFGDSVPKHRVAKCRAAVDASDGLLCIGSSLAVHSAYRFVKQAVNAGIPVAVINVGETRAEKEGLQITKIEAPAGPTLAACADSFV